MQLLTGSAVWAHQGWVGNFFPKGTKQADYLREYAKRLTTVEGNTTFYATPSKETVLRWAEETPAYFRFCPKLPRGVSHAGQLMPHLSEALRFVDLVRHLGARLGPLFLQLPPRYSPDSYALDLAANILSQGESSRMYRKLVYEDQIALQAVGFGVFTEQPNLFWVLAIMNQGHPVADGEKAMDAELEKMKTQPVSAAELEKAKNQIISNFILGRRTVQQKADAIGEAAVYGADAALVNTELDRYLRVTPEDIQRVARKYFTARNRTVATLVKPAAESQEESE